MNFPPKQPQYILQKTKYKNNIQNHKTHQNSYQPTQNAQSQNVHSDKTNNWMNNIQMTRIEIKNEQIQESFCGKIQFNQLFRNEMKNQQVSMMRQQLQGNQTETLKGFIIDGQNFCQFKLSDRLKIKTISLLFKIDPTLKQSIISENSLLELGLNSSKPTLLLNEKEEMFIKESQNVLGINYLINNRIKLNMNFSIPESKFQIIYTK